MTPERKAWWDSLPVYEKRVRKNIKSERKPIKAAKKALRVYHELDDYVYKKIIRENKQIIKALRKQIAMRPIWTATLLGNFYKCPRCIKNVWGNYQHCPECGQKLRWHCGQKLKLRCQQ